MSSDLTWISFLYISNRCLCLSGSDRAEFNTGEAISLANFRILLKCFSPFSCCNRLSNERHFTPHGHTFLSRKLFFSWRFRQWSLALWCLNNEICWANDRQQATGQLYPKVRLLLLYRSLLCCSCAFMDLNDLPHSQITIVDAEIPFLRFLALLFILSQRPLWIRSAPSSISQPCFNGILFSKRPNTCSSLQKSRNLYNWQEGTLFFYHKKNRSRARFTVDVLSFAFKKSPCEMTCCPPEQSQGVDRFLELNLFLTLIVRVWINQDQNKLFVPWYTQVYFIWESPA